MKKNTGVTEPATVEGWRKRVSSMKGTITKLRDNERIHIEHLARNQAAYENLRRGSDSALAEARKIQEAAVKKAADLLGELEAERQAYRGQCHTYATELEALREEVADFSRQRGELIMLGKSQEKAVAQAIERSERAVKDLAEHRTADQALLGILVAYEMLLGIHPDPELPNGRTPLGLPHVLIQQRLTTVFARMVANGGLGRPLQQLGVPDDVRRAVRL